MVKVRTAAAEWAEGEEGSRESLRFEGVPSGAPQLPVLPWESGPAT